MRAIAMNEEQGGFQQLTGFSRHGQDWSSIDEQEGLQNTKSAASILLGQIIKFLNSGGSSIEEISDQNGRLWGDFTFHFSNGDFLGTFASNTTIENKNNNSSSPIGLGGCIEEAEILSQRVIFDFEKKLFINDRIFGKELVWILKGTLDFTQVQDKNGVWHLEKNSDELFTNISRNGVGPYDLFVDPDDYEYEPYQYFKEIMRPGHNYDNLYKEGGIFMYGTVFHQGTVSIKNITLPVYDMWAFSIHAKFQIPYVQFVSNLNITFKFEEAEYSVPGYVWW